MRGAMSAPLIGAMLVSAVLFVTACTKSAPDQTADETVVPGQLQQNSAAADQRISSAQSGTPMAQRVATLGLLNKRNNLSQDIKLKPGETQRIGNVIVQLSACERTAPWETPRETGAFVQVQVRDTGGEQDWRKVFSGWLFKQSPSINVVEHPIYDVWIKDCAMHFPGEEAPLTSSASSR